MKKRILFLAILVFFLSSGCSVYKCKGKVYHNAYGMYNTHAYKR